MATSKSFLVRWRWFLYPRFFFPRPFCERCSVTERQNHSAPDGVLPPRPGDGGCGAVGSSSADASERLAARHALGTPPPFFAPSLPPSASSPEVSDSSLAALASASSSRTAFAASSSPSTTLAAVARIHSNVTASAPTPGLHVLCVATNAASGLTSIPTVLRPLVMPTTRLVPPPVNGSRSESPGSTSRMRSAAAACIPAGYSWNPCVVRG